MESAWYNPNRSQQQRDRVRFNGTKLYRYAMKMPTGLQEFLVTISDKVTSMTDLLKSPLATSSGKLQSVRETCLTSIRLFIDPEEVSRDKEESQSKLNDSRIDKLIIKLRKKYFPPPPTTPTDTSGNQLQKEDYPVRFNRFVQVEIVVRNILRPIPKVIWINP